MALARQGLGVPGAQPFALAFSGGALRHGRFPRCRPRDTSRPRKGRAAADSALAAPDARFSFACKRRPKDGLEPALFGPAARWRWRPGAIFSRRLRLELWPHMVRYAVDGQAHPASAGRRGR